MREGWEIKSIGELCDLSTGGTPSKTKREYFENGKIKWLVSGDIHKKEIFECEGRITDLGMQNSSAKYLPLNSVMIALNGQGKTRGTVALLRTKATCNQSLVAISPKNHQVLLPEYLFVNLNARYDEIRKITGDTGNDRRGLNMPILRNIQIPLPPLPEQKRIVAILDKAFAAIDKAKANAEQNLKNAKEVFESYLNEVFEKKGKDWGEAQLGDLTEVKDGTHDSPKYIGNGIPFVTQKNIKINGLSFDDTKFISEVDHNKFYKRSNVAYGDILISMIGANRGMAAVVDSRQIFSIKNVGLIKSSDKINANYLLYYLKSQLAMNYVMNKSNGGAQEFIGLTALRGFPIPIPTLNDQSKIINKLNAVKAETQKLEATYQKKIDDLDELKKSILQKAFSGELTLRQAQGNSKLKELV